MFRIVNTLLVAALMAAPVAAADLDEVAEKLIEAQSKLKSYSAKFKSQEEVTTTMTRESQGTYEWVRTDEYIMFRRDVKSLTTIDFDGDKQKNDENRTFMGDGKFYYQTNNDLKQTMKQDYDPESLETQNVASELTQLSNQYDSLEVTGEEKVNGQDCWVIEASGNYMSEGADPEDPFVIVDKEKHWFAKDSGMLVKMEGYDKAGKVVRKLEYSDIKKDEKIDPARFEAPKG